MVEEERLEREFVGDGLISSKLVRVLRTRTYSRTRAREGGGRVLE